MIVNSKGVWKDVLSEIYEAYLSNSQHSFPPPMRLTVLYAKPTVCGGGVAGWQLSQERQSRLLQRHGT